MSTEITRYSEFSVNQRAMIEAALCGLTITQIATRCKVENSLVRNFIESAAAQRFMRGHAILRLGGQGAAVAIETLIEIASDKEAPKQARVSASDKLLSYTGLQIGTVDSDKSPANMSQKELMARLAKLQEEAISRAKDVKIVDVTPDKDEIDLAELMK